MTCSSLFMAIRERRKRALKRVLLAILMGVLLMAHGAPDDSNVLGGVDVRRGDDLSELAVRLGSVVRYHRGGNVLLAEGFEEGLSGWDTNGDGAGREVVISNDRSFTGGYSCRITSGTGLEPFMGIMKYMPPVGECLIGLQTCFSLNSHVSYLDFKITYGKPGLGSYFSIKYDHVHGTLSYEDTTAAWDEFASPGVLYDGLGNWHNIKLVVDMVTGSHVKAYLDGHAYDMTGLMPRTGAWLPGPFLGVYLYVHGKSADSGIVYFDNVVATYNEVMEGGER